MNADDEKLCLEELDHLILDADKKINLQYVSNTWSVPFKTSEAILQKWLEIYKGGKKIAKEYLIIGTDKKNNAVITVIPESKLAKVDEICPDAMKMLYSIEIASLNGRCLNLPEKSEKKFISLKLESQKRDVKVQKIVVPAAVKKEPEPVKKPLPNMFAATKPKQPEIKTETSKPAESVTKTSPKGKSPKKNQPPAKSSQAKSIANFFGSKPSSSATNKTASDKSVAEATVKIEKVEIKDEPESSHEHNKKKSKQSESVKTSKNSNKRNLSCTSDSNDEKSSGKKKTDREMPTKKKPKLQPKSSKSRIMQICDSSSDEDESNKEAPLPMSEDEDEKPVKKEKEKENKTPSPQKHENARSNNSTNASSSGKRRVKVKKMVTRTYEDEDGFINTVREEEVVSCSEDEPESAMVEPPAKKPVSSTSTSTTNNKKKISPPAGKKQGSILSFFSKK